MYNFKKKIKSLIPIVGKDNYHKQKEIIENHEEVNKFNKEKRWDYFCQINDLKRQIIQKEAEINKLIQRINELTTENENLKKRRQDSGYDEGVESPEVEKLESKKQILGERINELETQLTNLTEEKDRNQAIARGVLKQLRDKWQADKEGLEDQKEKLTAENGELCQEIEQLKRALAEEKKKHEDYLKKNGNLLILAEDRRKQTRIENLQAEVDLLELELRGEKQMSQSQVSSYRQRIHSLKNEKSRIINELRHLRQTTVGTNNPGWKSALWQKTKKLGLTALAAYGSYQTGYSGSNSCPTQINQPPSLVRLNTTPLALPNYSTNHTHCQIENPLLNPFFSDNFHSDLGNSTPPQYLDFSESDLELISILNTASSELGITYPINSTTLKPFKEAIAKLTDLETKLGKLNELDTKLGGVNLTDIPAGKTLQDLIENPDAAALQTQISQLQTQLDDKEKEVVKEIHDELRLGLANDSITKEGVLAKITQLTNNSPSRTSQVPDQTATAVKKELDDLLKIKFSQPTMDATAVKKELDEFLSENNQLEPQELKPLDLPDDWKTKIKKNLELEVDYKRILEDNAKLNQNNQDLERKITELVKRPTFEEFNELKDNQKPFHLPSNWETQLAQIPSLKEQIKALSSRPDISQTEFALYKSPSQVEQRETEIRKEFENYINPTNATDLVRHNLFTKNQVEAAVQAKEKEWENKGLINPFNQTEVEQAGLVGKLDYEQIKQARDNRPNIALTDYEVLLGQHKQTQTSLEEWTKIFPDFTPLQIQQKLDQVSPNGGNQTEIDKLKVDLDLAVQANKNMQIERDNALRSLDFFNDQLNDIYQEEVRGKRRERKLNEKLNQKTKPTENFQSSQAPTHDTQTNLLQSLFNFLAGAGVGFSGGYVSKKDAPEIDMEELKKGINTLIEQKDALRKERDEWKDKYENHKCDEASTTSCSHSDIPEITTIQQENEQAIIQEINNSLQLGLGQNPKLKQVINRIQELINKDPIEINTPFGESLQVIKELEISSLEQLFPNQLETSFIQQIETAQNYKQLTQIRNEFLAKHLNGEVKQSSEPVEITKKSKNVERYVWISLLASLVVGLLMVIKALINSKKSKRKILQKVFKLIQQTRSRKF